MTESPPVLPAPPSPPARRRHPVARVLGAIVGWIAAAVAAAGLGAHFLDTHHQSLIVLAAGAATLAPLSLVALGLHLWRRGWIAVVASLLLVGAQVVVYAPAFVAQPAPAAAATVHVLTQNMLFGEADARHLVDEVRSADVDLFVAQELTVEAVTRLRAAGLDRLLPYSVLDPRPEAAGTGLWSRYPIADEKRFVPEGLVGVSARVSLPGGVGLTALTVHPSAPFPADPAQWLSDLDRIRGLLRDLPRGPVVAGGDFNATADHVRFRQLLVGGWQDGARQAGAGLLRTWPSNRGVPALVGIDHVLTRGTVATSVVTVPAPGSDHLGLLATVVVPR